MSSHVTDPTPDASAVPTAPLAGEFDISRVAELRDTILDAPAEGDHVVVDLREVTFMDSSALRTLLEVRSHLDRRDQVLVLQNVPSQVRTLLEVTRTGQLFRVDAP
jgi:anti-anti-sigma factor